MALLPKLHNHREAVRSDALPLQALEDFMARWMDTWPYARLNGADFVPNVDINETANGYEVTAEIPGMKREDIQVLVEDNQLILKGEKRTERERKGKKSYFSECSYGSFLRVLPFTERIDEKNVDARYADGILHVQLRRSQDQSASSKRIAVH